MKLQHIELVEALNHRGLPAHEDDDQGMLTKRLTDWIAFSEIMREDYGLLPLASTPHVVHVVALQTNFDSLINDSETNKK